MTLNGTDANDGTVYNDWVMMDASETSDGSNGNMSIYEDNSTDLEFAVSWSKNADGSTYLEFTTYGENGMKITVTANADQTGSLEMYEYNNGEYVKTMKITWTSTGGEWWEYDSQGNVSDHGSF
ncbi:MAG: hypothetical protein GXO87_12430 [Chlorobi bacterium]|nr:hypothetical protein [Chlorobiota bacterium]